MLSIVVLTLLISLLSCYFYLQYAIKAQIFDIPNSRSSHSIPTPRGGGVGIVFTFLTVSFFALIHTASLLEFWGMLVAGLLVSLIGYFDDKGHIEAKWRLIIHFLACFLIIQNVGLLPKIDVFGLSIDITIGGGVLILLGLVWLLNLFNFMDGIDGLAASEVIVCSFVMGTLIWAIDEQSQMSDLISLHFLLGASTLGFLAFNFPSAKIFMGDVGSGFVGVMCGALMLFSFAENSVLLWSWLIIMGVFVTDSTFTLLRRLINRKRVFQAHRDHAFQHAAKKLNSHKLTTVIVIFINLVFLAPLAALVAFSQIDGVVGVLVAYAPLVLLVIKLEAGKEQSS